MQNILIIIGGPGSGKGTIAKLLMQEHKFNYIETGALFRGLSSDSDIAKIMERGGLIPDEKIFPLIIKRTSDNHDILFDGFPRNVSQAKWLIDNFNANINVIYLNLIETIMIDRIHMRLSNGSTRADDAKNEIINKRLGAFTNQTLPAIKFLSKSQDVNFMEIDGSGTPDEIASIAKSYFSFLAQE